MYRKRNLKDDLLHMWETKGLLVRLIILNAGVFVLLAVFRVVTFLLGVSDWNNVLIRYVSLPADIGTFFLQPWSLVSYFFSHQGFLHILFNMLVLHWFGGLLTGFLGERHLRNLYILGGIAAGIFFMLIYNILPYYAPFAGSTILLGASGAVYAVVVGTAVFMPDYSLHLMFIGPVRIRYIALSYVFLSFIGIVGSNSGGALAHLGGALMGYLYIRYMRQGVNLGAGVDTVFGWFTRSEDVTPPRSRGRSTARKSTAGRADKSSDQGDMDAILDKISESGYDSLTAREKEKLFRLSEKK